MRSTPTVLRVAAAVTVVAAILSAVGCGDDGAPTQGDLLPVVELTFPGATESLRSWSPEDHDQSVDGLDLSSRAELSRRFRLAAPVERAVLFAWYGDRLEPAGWAERVSGDNAASFFRAVGDRTHIYRVEAGTPSVRSFTVTYRIGFREE